MTTRAILISALRHVWPDWAVNSCAVARHRIAVVALIAIGAATTIASAVLPPQGEAAPAIRLKDLHDTEINTHDLAPRSLVLIFGEFAHPGAIQACAEVLDALEDSRVERDSVIPILIVAQNADSAKLREEAAGGRFPAIVLHDSARDAFGTYHVLVLPSVVVVDGTGKVVHSMPGFVPRFKEILSASVLVATGKEPPEILARAIDPSGVPPPSQESLRASRLAHLGAELAKHKLFDMAEARYAEALAVAPDSVDAKLGLGNLMLDQDRAADAATLFKSILASHADSVEATLGLAAAQLAQGGDALATAEAAVRGVIGKTVSNARAHYLLGRILEARSDLQSAAHEYRKATELLLQR